jgi:WD40 repeat protein
MEKSVQTFHSGGVRTLSLASRNSNMVSLSLDEEAVNTWDINNLSGHHDFRDSFIGRPDEMPYHVDIHPNGNIIAFACEDDVKECAITDIKFKLLRKIPTKVAFTFGPKDQPYANQAHVSLVRYSNGGHLLAVVTGKLGQVFSTNNYSYAPADFKLSAHREMVMTDHSANINDIVWSTDDSYLFTCANDGSVYSWKVFGTRRDADYISKGLIASKVVVGTSLVKNPIIAYFEVEAFVPTLGKRASSRTIRLTSPDQEGQPPSSAKSSRSRRGSVSAKVSQFGDAGFDGSFLIGKNKQLLALWYDNVSLTPSIINLDTPVTAITLGKFDGIESQDVCVLGLYDGRILISLLPFPVRVVQDPTMNIGIMPTNVTTAISTDDSNQLTSDDVSAQSEYLNEVHCKVIQLHASSTQSVVISRTGLWVISGGLDGSIFMLGTSSRAKEMLNIPEYSQAPECTLVLTDKNRLKTIRERIEEVDVLIEDTKKSCDRMITKQNEQHQHHSGCT